MSGYHGLKEVIESVNVCSVTIHLNVCLLVIHPCQLYFAQHVIKYLT